LKVGHCSSNMFHGRRIPSSRSCDVTFLHSLVIPTNPLNLGKLNKEDMRRRTNQYWPHDHQNWITLWNNQHSYLIEETEFKGNGHLHYNALYM